MGRRQGTAVRWKGSQGTMRHVRGRRPRTRQGEGMIGRGNSQEGSDAVGRWTGIGGSGTLTWVVIDSGASSLASHQTSCPLTSATPLSPPSPLSHLCPLFPLGQYCQAPLLIPLCPLLTPLPQLTKRPSFLAPPLRGPRHLQLAWRPCSPPFPPSPALVPPPEAASHILPNPP